MKGSSIMSNESMSPFKALSHLTYSAIMDHDTTVAQCVEWNEIVATELRALEIIKEKIDMGVVIIGDQPKIRITYNGLLHFYDISQDEYETLKKVLL
jgi:hypothetical protein